MAPEVLHDKGYNAKADVYSAGCILYVLLTGRPAFKSVNMKDILARNRRAEIDFSGKCW